MAVGLNTLLTLPFFNWSVRDALTNHPILAGKHGNWTDSVEIAHLSQSTICQDPSKRLSNVSVIVLTESHWLPGLLQSDYAKFQKWFGIGPSLLGIGPSLFAIGPALFSPSKRLSPIIAEMESALRHEVQHTIGLQIGMQDADDIKLAGASIQPHSIYDLSSHVCRGFSSLIPCCTALKCSFKHCTHWLVPRYRQCKYARCRNESSRAE